MGKKILSEAYNRVAKITGLSPLGSNFRRILRDPNKWNIFVESLASSLPPAIMEDFRTLSNNTRIPLLENASFTANPYETLTLPILRMFYPKLIAKDIVTVSPIDKPEVIKTFIRAYVGTAEDDASGVYPYQLPYISNTLPSTGVSRGPSAGIVSEKVITSKTVNLISEVNPDLVGYTYIDKDFRIESAYVSTTDSTDNLAEVVITPPIMADVDGNFSREISWKEGGTTVTDIIVGSINFEKGVLNWSSVRGYVKRLSVSYFLSLEKNKINPKVRFVPEKIRLAVVQRQLSAEWTIAFEQDMKALYDINLQEELIDLMARQIAVDIDREIIEGLLSCIGLYGSPDHVSTFYLTPPDNYNWGPKMWYSNILPKINSLSAAIFNDTKIAAGNTIACNPIDAAILESLNEFRYDGASDKDGDLGYANATIQGNKYKVVVSQNIPQHKMIILYKPAKEQESVFYYAPYVPIMITPYPLGPNPNITLMTRYAIKAVRPEGVSVLMVNEGKEPTP